MSHRKAKKSVPEIRDLVPKSQGQDRNYHQKTESSDAFASFDQERQRQLFLTYVLEYKWSLVDGLLDRKVRYSTYDSNVELHTSSEKLFPLKISQDLRIHFYFYFSV